MQHQSENIILKKTIEFSLNVIEYVELLRPATAIGASVHEAQNAKSKADFVHKFKIAAKETEETKYWLTLCREAKNDANCDDLAYQLHEIDKIITKIISTSKTKKLSN